MIDLEKRLQASLIPNKLQEEIMIHITKLISNNKDLVLEVNMLRKEVARLERAAVHYNWALSPDRMGGQLTNFEINEANSWR